MGCPPPSGLGGSLRRHHNGDLFRADLASLSDRARWRGSKFDFPHRPSVFEIQILEDERLVGVPIPSEGATANGGPTLLDFGGNARNAEAMALTLHALFPHRNAVAFHYRGYCEAAAGRASGRRPSERTQAERADALLGLARNIRSPGAKECRRAILPVGFSLVGAVAAYLTKHPASLRLDSDHAFRLARGRGPRSLLVGSCRLAPPQSHAHHRGCLRLECPSRMSLQP